MTDMTNWNADDWHLLLSQYLDSRATHPNGLNTVALLIADSMDALRAPAATPPPPVSFMEAMNIVERGFDTWKDKPHNARWYSRIDGTPIPNDLKVNIAEAICYSSLTSAPASPCFDITEQTQETLKALSDWCEKARYELGGIDGYDYRSGEEFGIRRVELQIEKVLHATAVSRPHGGSK